MLTSPLITSPVIALPASRIREYYSINGLDGDVGLDRTPPGVRSPVAHPTIDESSLVGESRGVEICLNATECGGTGIN